MKTVTFTRKSLAGIQIFRVKKALIFARKGYVTAKNLIECIKKEYWRNRKFCGLYYTDTTGEYRLIIKESPFRKRNPETKSIMEEYNIVTHGQLDMPVDEYLNSVRLKKGIQWLMAVEQNRFGYDFLAPIRIIEQQEKGNVSSDIMDYCEYVRDNL